MKILSDFRDHYDFAPSGDGADLRRYAKDAGPTRREKLSLLKVLRC